MRWLQHKNKYNEWRHRTLIENSHQILLRVTIGHWRSSKVKELWSLTAKWVTSRPNFRQKSSLWYFWTEIVKMDKLSFRAGGLWTSVTYLMLFQSITRYDHKCDCHMRSKFSNSFTMSLHKLLMTRIYYLYDTLTLTNGHLTLTKKIWFSMRLKNKDLGIKIISHLYVLFSTLKISLIMNSISL